MNQLDMYQGVNYKNTRDKVQTLVLHLSTNEGTSYHPIGTMFNTDHISFKVELQEPMIIDELSDVYLEFVLTTNTKGSGSEASPATGDYSAFLLSIDQFNVNSVSNTSNSFNKILIPNEHPSAVQEKTDTHVTLHKSKKLNYVCSINPCKLYEISGKFTFLDGSIPFHPVRGVLGKFFADSPNFSGLPLPTTPATSIDIGHLDTKKVLEFRVDVHDVVHDTEIFMFQSGRVAAKPEDNYIIPWKTTEKSAATGLDATTYNDHNDDHDDHGTESQLTYVANQLPIMHGYYWIVIAPYNTSLNDVVLGSTFVELAGFGLSLASGVAQALGVPAGSPGNWPAGTLSLKIKEGSADEHTYWSVTHSGTSTNLYWFRWEHTDHSRNLVTQFNIVPRD